MNEKVGAKLMRSRISPKKVGPVVDLIKGKSVRDAKIALKFDGTKASDILFKVLNSAEANAVNNKKMNKTDLVISEIWVGPGPTFKMMRFAGRGNVRPILKRTSNIYINLEERKK